LLLRTLPVRDPGELMRLAMDISATHAYRQKTWMMRTQLSEKRSKRLTESEMSHIQDG
jgi:hypothetical protein